MRVSSLTAPLPTAWKEKEIGNVPCVGKDWKKTPAFSMQMEIANKRAISSEISGFCFLIPILLLILHINTIPAGWPCAGTVITLLWPLQVQHCSSQPSAVSVRDGGSACSCESCDSTAEICESGLTCPCGTAGFALPAGFTIALYSSMAEKHPWRTVCIWVKQFNLVKQSQFNAIL